MSQANVTVRGARKPGPLSRQNPKMARGYKWNMQIGLTFRGLHHDTTCGVRTSPRRHQGRPRDVHSSPAEASSEEHLSSCIPGLPCNRPSKTVRFRIVGVTCFPRPTTLQGGLPRSALLNLYYLTTRRTTGTAGTLTGGAGSSIFAPRRTRMIKGCDLLRNPGSPTRLTTDLSPLADRYKDRELRLTFIALKIVGWHR